MVGCKPGLKYVTSSTPRICVSLYSLFRVRRSVGVKIGKTLFSNNALADTLNHGHGLAAASLYFKFKSDDNKYARLCPPAIKLKNIII